MKIVNIKKGEEIKAIEILPNRAEEDFDGIDAAVRDIISEVRAKGDEALYYFTEKFGGPSKELMGELRVSKSEIDEAYDSVEDEAKKAFEIASSNIRAFHEKQKIESWSYRPGGDIVLGQLLRPVRNVGVYVPGGTAPLCSTVFMNVIPAKIAGCERVVMCTPAGKDGRIDRYILAAARIAGADEIYRVGGAQAVAAMAYGTESIKPVNKITGPGSAYVARAKKYVFGRVDIDMIAGPSEVTVIADENSDPAYIAADMLSQAEHDVLAQAVLITTSRDTADRTAAEIERQLKALERREIAEKSIEDNAVIYIVEDLDSALNIANEIAPEHLELSFRNAEAYLDKVQCAGAVLYGEYSSEPLGDYVAGPNHTLPTSGTAKFASPLGVYDFMTRASLIHYSKEDLAEVKDAIVVMSDREGLTAHGNAIKIRFKS